MPKVYKTVVAANGGFFDESKVFEALNFFNQKSFLTLSVC